MRCGIGYFHWLILIKEQDQSMETIKHLPHLYGYLYLHPSTKKKKTQRETYSMELYNIFLLYVDKRMHTLYTHAQKVLDFTFVKLLMFGGLCISSLKVKHCGCMNLST